MTTSRGVQERALADALAAVKVAPQDAPTVALARRYAQMIDVLRGEEDEPAALAKLGPLYLAALTALGLHPGARAAQQGKVPPAEAEKPVSALQRQRDELAARRAEREAAGT